ncbi:hypothetical protein [Clostridium baratii]|uniref:hypothetical protein n=1 Tax=Clostridium baratii TaxID=1561 RepID=UPI0030D5FB20
MKNSEYMKGLESLRKQSVGERRNNDTRIYDEAIEREEKGLSRFSTEELVEELLKRDSAVLSTKTEKPRVVIIDNITDKIKFLEAIRDAFRALTIDINDFEALEIRERLKMLGHEITMDYKTLLNLIDEIAVG